MYIYIYSCIKPNAYFYHFMIADLYFIHIFIKKKPKKKVNAIALNDKKHIVQVCASHI